MNHFEALVEKKIHKAQARGDFENLPGMGKPLQLDDASMIPEELRMAYKVLKNAGCIPRELELQKEINQLNEAIQEGGEDDIKLRRRMQCLMIRLDLLGRDTPLMVQSEYYQKALNKLAHTQ